MTPVGPAEAVSQRIHFADLARATSYVEVLRDKLVDLTFRNPLLNITGGRATRLRISAPEPGGLYDALVTAGKRMSFARPRDVEGAAYGLEEADSGRLFDDEEIPGDLVVDYEQSSARNVRELQQKLRRLRENQRRADQEMGINVLRLMLGTVGIPDQRDRVEIRWAPLLLVPVRLDIQRDGPFRLSVEEVDVSLNPALRLLLERDHGVALPDPEPHLELAEGDADINGYLSEVADALAGKPFAVTGDAWLSVASFHKLAMWDDLGGPEVPHEVAAHPTVSALVDGEPPIPEIPREVAEDLREDPETYPVLPADSSQLEVLRQVTAGRSVVVQGPPGTGKSQTIVNVIVDALRQNKTVLFVSQKRVALEVVLRRMAEVGLDTACLDLHDHNTGRRAVLDDLQRCLELALEPPQSPGAPERFARRRHLREQLDAYVWEVHRPRGAAGYTAYRVVGEIVARRSAPEVDCGFTAAEAHGLTREDEQEIRARIRRVAAAGVWDNEAAHPWAGTVPRAPYDEIRRAVEAAAPRLTQVLETLGQLTAQLESAVGGPLGDPALRGLRAVAAALELLAERPDRVDARLLRTDAAQLSRIAAILEEAERHHRDLERTGTELAVLGANRLRAHAPVIGDLLVRYRQRWSSRLSRMSGDYREDKARLEALSGRRLGYRKAVRALEAVRAEQEIHVALNDLDGQLRRLGMALPSSEELRDRREAVSWAARVQATFQGAPLSEPAAQWLATVRWPEASEFARRLRDAHTKVVEAMRPLVEVLFGDTDPLAARTPQAAADAVQGWVERITDLRSWMAHVAAKDEAREAGLGAFLDAARERKVRSQDLEDAFVADLRRRWLSHAHRESPILHRFAGQSHETLIAEFRKLDRELHREAAAWARHQVHAAQEPIRVAEEYRSVGGRPGANRPDSDELVKALKPQLRTLRHELQKKRRHRPIRQLLPSISELVALLKPCVLASPLSVATYLPRGRFRFDLVVMDEASQVLPEDALGALLRARQAAVFGDSQQLPPTTFFQRVAEDEDDDASASSTDDDVFESILDAFEGSGLPSIPLRWHYRSRDERLIAFSNRHYYEDAPLITFPAPRRDVSDTGVRLVLAEDGVYDPRTRRNEAEARRVADLVAEHLAERRRRSLGVIALSLPQAEAIETELHRRARAGDDHLAEVLSTVGEADRTEEPLFIKNLENVQGDERDEIILSVGYGPNQPGGRVPLRFGPLNNAGGERRLNVAITRARYRTTVVSSFVPDQLSKVEHTAKNRGPVLLYRYLRYCHAEGRTDEVAVDGQPVGEPESEFEAQVARALGDRGYEIHHQVGASKFRIDLAVVDPGFPDRYVCGIECDGRTYHSAPAARDRDRLRQEILEGLGWTILRVWSTDWFADPDAEIGRLVERIEAARRAQATAAGVMKATDSHEPVKRRKGRGRRTLRADDL